MAPFSALKTGEQFIADNGRRLVIRILQIDRKSISPQRALGDRRDKAVSYESRRAGNKDDGREQQINTDEQTPLKISRIYREDSLKNTVSHRGHRDHREKTPVFLPESCKRREYRVPLRSRHARNETTVFRVIQSGSPG
jgi:hypothetical protein